MLEQLLLRAEPPVHRPQKRARALGALDVSAADKAGDATVRSQLAELYQQLGDEDIVRSLASEVAASDELSVAMLAEARGDSEVALTHFDQVLEAKQVATFPARV